MSTSAAFDLFSYFRSIRYFPNLSSLPVAQVFVPSPSYLCSTTFINSYIFSHCYFNFQFFDYLWDETCYFGQEGLVFLSLTPACSCPCTELSSRRKFIFLFNNDHLGIFWDGKFHFNKLNGYSSKITLLFSISKMICFFHVLVNQFKENHKYLPSTDLFNNTSMLLLE